MVFGSVTFLFRFLPIFLICYFVVPQRMKNFILFLGSLIFCAWGKPVCVVLMLITVLSDYAHGILIERYRREKAAGVLLASSVLINLSLLFYAGYGSIGVFFYTLQTMSYTIDVYRGEVKARRNLLDYAVYVTMFPQLSAGPIVKYRQVEADLHFRKTDIYMISYGTKRFVCGLAKTVLLAGSLGTLWSEVSSCDFGELSVLTAWLGIFAFALRIYFDFSGYSDMAIGLGAVLGFRFPENFNYPYVSVSVSEFWRRWHITLGSWLREYVYIPLGGNRKGPGRQFVNILVVWALTGMWYGSGFNFLLWGMWFALFLILEKLFLKYILRGLPKVFGGLYTCAVVLIGWVFFAFDSAVEMKGYLAAMFGASGVGIWDRQALFFGREYAVILVIGIFACIPMAKRFATRLEKSRTGYAIALYRLGEKVIPPILLLLSIAGVMASSYQPYW